MTLQRPPRPQPSLGKATMILGIGTDIVEIVRIGQMIERHGEHFLQRVFTEEEIRYCQ
ncbi:MAG TPA: 4'-phosphopantetheinyl transferase superfamily protein, partial [Planctomycetaceae bacterium]|nr:4'-phosphopantetheinyl transferase superfamily protein [Planctomycetaceae bacterium]